jgi:hypothetical protein
MIARYHTGNGIPYQAPALRSGPEKYRAFIAARGKE